MSAITFDTLAYAKRLREAGIPESQAEAQAAALVDVLKESAGELATRNDITALRQDINRLESRINVMEERTEGRFKLLQWMLGFNLALAVAVLFLLLRH